MGRKHMSESKREEEEEEEGMVDFNREEVLGLSTCFRRYG